MKTALSVLISCSTLAILGAPSAMAYPNPYGPACMFGISYDSYGRGIEDGFKGSHRGAITLDPQCYAFGVESGRATRAQDSSSFCGSDFDHGYSAGNTLSSHDPDGDCFEQGYKAGEAALDIAAREHKAQPDCQNAYDQGQTDAGNHTVSATPSDPVPAHCYQLGLFEGPAPLR